jgi:hypothetical protein
VTKVNKGLSDQWKYVTKQLLNHLPSLCPIDEWNLALDAEIEALQEDLVTTGGKEQQHYGLALKAGLHLMNESLDKSHAISQEITNATGSYWHGLMHRMEGDYSNAKYWFADAGNHPVYSALINQVRDYLTASDLVEIEHEALRSKVAVLINSPVWNPSVFVDAVELQVTLVQQSKVEEWLQHIQQFEMKLLLQYCYEKSCGGSLLEEIGYQ